jgi:NAD-dependent dihydropyrimidine dehydrogenase PreA subunit
MRIRKIIAIDEEKCNGCGQCIPACPEGALAIVDGKARLVKESYCDGLGACIGGCPQGALRIVEREAEDYDPQAVTAHLSRQSSESASRHPVTRECPADPAEGIWGCPEASWTPEEAPASTLRQWPVKLYLVSPDAPFLRSADLLVVADCVPVAYAGFHRDLLKGRAVVMGCPKLDDAAAYRQKLAGIIAKAAPARILVAYMEVGCCFGLVHLVRQAVAAAGKEVSVETVMIGIQGEVLERGTVYPARPKEDLSTV